MRAKMMLFAAALFLLPGTAGYAQDQPISNDEFAKAAFLHMTDSLLNEMELSDSLALDFKCEKCPEDYFSNIMIGALKQRVANLYINNGDISFDRLEINLYNYAFYYDKVGGSLFSSGQLIRNFEAALFATLYDDNARVLWQKDYSDKYSEEIEWDFAREMQTQNSGVFRAELPSTNRNRIWEPVIISGLLGGLVYLFFSSR